MPGRASLRGWPGSGFLVRMPISPATMWPAAGRFLAFSSSGLPRGVPCAPLGTRRTRRSSQLSGRSP